MILLDGKKAREHFVQPLKERLAKIDKSLVVILVGENPDSETFVNMKQRFGQTLNVEVIVLRLPEATSQHELLETIAELNHDVSVGGIIIQLPLPDHIDKERVLGAILFEKDLDALGSIARDVFYQSKGTLAIPATPRGIMSLLDFYEIGIEGKEVVVIGKSNLVGKPTAYLLEQAGGKVTLCDKETKNIPSQTRNADIIVVAAGAPALVTAEYIDPEKNTVVVDVGITKDSHQKIHGDVDFDGVKDRVGGLSPVPGGVGPMTVLSLFENFADAVEG